MSGVLLGEGIYGLTRVSDTTDWRYWMAEVVVSAAIVGWVAFGTRSLRATSACLCMTAAAAAVVYLAAVTV